MDIYPYVDKYLQRFHSTETWQYCQILYTDDLSTLKSPSDRTKTWRRDDIRYD